MKKKMRKMRRKINDSKTYVTSKIDFSKYHPTNIDFQMKTSVF